MHSPFGHSPHFCSIPVGPNQISRVGSRQIPSDPVRSHRIPSDPVSRSCQIPLADPVRSQHFQSEPVGSHRIPSDPILALVASRSDKVGTLAAFSSRMPLAALAALAALAVASFTSISPPTPPRATLHSPINCPARSPIAPADAGPSSIRAWGMRSGWLISPPTMRWTTY